MALTWCDEADGALADLAKEGSGVDYVLFAVQDAKKAPRLVMAGKGQGGREAVQQCLQATPEDGICIGCFLVSAIDQEEGSTAISVRSKFIHVTYMGDAVGVMLRGKVVSWYAQAKKRFPQAAVTVQLKGGDLDDLQVEALEASLSSAGGAHKPKRYSFQNSTIMGRDAAAAARAAEEAKRLAEAEAKQKAEEERKAAEEERKRKAEQARQRAEEERLAKLKAEEEAMLKAQEEARLKAQEEARLKAEEDARRKAEEEARRLAEEEARRLAEEERRRQEEAERLRTKILITENATLGEGRKLVLLLSKTSGNPQQSAQTARVKVIMDGVGLPTDELEEVDGSDESMKDQRNALFDLSGLRAKYPQLFLREEDGTLKFIGDFEEVQYLNDSGTIEQTLGVTIKTTQKTVTVTDTADDGGAEVVIDKEEVTSMKVSSPPLAPKEAIGKNAEPTPATVKASESKDDEPSPELVTVVSTGVEVQIEAGAVADDVPPTATQEEAKDATPAPAQEEEPTPVTQSNTTEGEVSPEVPSVISEEGGAPTDDAPVTTGDEPPVQDQKAKEQKTAVEEPPVADFGAMEIADDQQIVAPADDTPLSTENEPPVEDQKAEEQETVVEEPPVADFGAMEIADDQQEVAPADDTPLSTENEPPVEDQTVEEEQETPVEDDTPNNEEPQES